MIRGTVALPVWRSKPIAWLCMESLCRMLPPSEEWELVVFEENHPEQLGESFFTAYRNRLRKAGCVRLYYFSAAEKVPLSQKWVMISMVTELTSEYFCLCAADNYYSPHMLIEAEESVKSAAWTITPRGYFYDFETERVIRYEYYYRTGLQMTARTSLVRNFKMDVVNKGVDCWFSRQIGNQGNIIDSGYWKEILCTHGLNNISTQRTEYFKMMEPPFYHTKVKLADIVPSDIAWRLNTLAEALKIRNTIK